MISALDLRPGSIIVHEGNLYRVLNILHLTPGNKRGKVQTELRNLKDGTKLEYRFRSEDRVEKASLESHEMEFLYQDGGEFYFMNTENYEQGHLPRDILGNGALFLQPNVRVQVQFWNGQAVGIDLPPSVALKVVETEPGMKRATAASSYKPAKLENGVQIRVPPFVNVGDVVKVDTASLEYIERI